MTLWRKTQRTHLHHRALRTYLAPTNWAGMCSRDSCTRHGSICWSDSLVPCYLPCSGPSSATTGSGRRPVLGALAAYRGRWWDSAIMRTADVVQAFPTYILIIALVFVLGQGLPAILVAFTVAAWVVYARLMRTEALRVRSMDYVDAARAGGLPGWRILWRHVFPNAAGQTVVYLPSDIVIATLGLAGLSYLGLGIPAPTPEWGAMIADGQIFIRDQWWLSTVPGLVVVAFGLGLSLVGEGFEEWIRR